jgi:AraC-like DNA-binding protein
VPPEGRFTGRLDWQRSKSFSLYLCSDIRADVTRGNRHIRADPRGNYGLLVPVAGTARMESTASSAEMRPGLLALADLDRPAGVAHGDDFRAVVLLAPSREIGGRSPALTREPGVFSGVSGLGRLIREMMTVLQQEHAWFAEATFDVACEQLLDLVCFAAEGATDTAPTEHGETVEAQIRRYIRRHAEDSDLNVATIAHALGWSTRYIQNVLTAADTTARDLIRRERLALARRRLASPEWAGHSVASIAYSCGFGSHASFSTAFRQEFHQTPSEARNSAA